MSKRILLAVTSNERLGESGQGTGAWLEELAQAYWTFADAGWDIDICSPRGGAAPIDPTSIQEPWLSQLGQRFLDDSQASRRIAHTVAFGDITPASHAAVYLIGGVGTMWDFPESRPLARLLEALHRAQRPIAAVCHGVSGLASARRADGAAFMKGLRLTCFSNLEEDQVGYTPHLPVLPQDLLISRGAIYSCAEPWQEHVVVDGLVMTGQNPASAGPLARIVLAELRSER